MASVASRKRSRSIEADPMVHKKPNLAADPPRINGTVAESGEGNDQGNVLLESFRKEAIYRKMKYYSRENDRNQARIAELERRKTTCEAGLAAISACWAQLLQTVQLLTKPEELPPIEPEIQRALDMTAHVSDEQSELLDGMEKHMQATSSIVTKFVQLGESNATLARDPAYLDCQAAKSECTALRVQMMQVQSQFQESEAEKEQLRARLISAESWIDRLQSKTVSCIEAKKPTGEAHDASAVSNEIKSETPPPTSSSQSPNGHLTGSLDSELETLRVLAKHREHCVKEIEAILCEKDVRIGRLELDLRSVSSDIIKESPHYKRLLDHASKLQEDLSVRDKTIDDLLHDKEELKNTYEESQQHLQNDSDNTCQELQARLAKRDADIARLREQRERLTCELNERKAKEISRSKLSHDYAISSRSKEERINLLSQEVARLKSRLATSTGDQDLLNFLLGQYSGQDIDISHDEHFRAKLTEAEHRVKALEETLAQYQEEHPDVATHMQSEAQTRQELAKAQDMLNKYQSVYGESSSLPPDVDSLAAELKSKAAELSTLRLREEERSQTESGLYVELEKLSAAWETLDKQLKTRIDQVQVLEEKTRQSQQERAKAENKFYAAMKDKDAAVSEAKNAARSAEKQAKVLEKLTALNNSLKAEVSSLDREKTHLQKALHGSDKKVSGLENKFSAAQAHIESLRKRNDEIMGPVKDITRAYEEKIKVIRAREEELLKTKTRLEHQHATSLKQISHEGHDKATERYREEVDKLNSILKCSTCQQAYRKMVITKCMHTFCKQCIDSRITSRQRKCPHCSVSFAQSEVQQIFFQ